ncbi:MAG TPA: DUF2232 domain-containing protein [Thermoanaerobaculaceae bacterium]|nr:DUF2232 domain-containing protein [Thermoanaerobaculaceae bacterium]HPS77305.1 DUF2232 domain-containing protein [Thermoanaerobaculaceae bacterium]
MAGLFSLLVFLSLPLVPIIGVFLALLAPLPLLQVIASGRSGFMAWGWVAVVLAGGVLLSSEAWLAAVAVGYLLVTVWPATSVEIWARRGWREGRWLASVVLIALLIATASLAATFYPVFPPERLSAIVAASWEEAGGIPTWLKGVSATGPELELALRLFTYLIPSLAALYVLMVASFLRPRLRVVGVPVEVGSFEAYRSDEWLPIGFILGGLGWVFLPEPGKWLAANLLITIAGLYFVHGLAIIHFYLGPRLRHSRWIRAGVLVLALQMPVAAMLSVLGLADNFVRLRRSGEKDEGSDQ